MRPAERRVEEARAAVAAAEQQLSRARTRLEAAEGELTRPLRGVDVATHALAYLEQEDPQKRSQRLEAMPDDDLARVALEGWLHYPAWFELVQGWQGVVIGGKDPLATFLTAISKDDRIEALGNRTGCYRPRGWSAQLEDDLQRWIGRRNIG